MRISRWINGIATALRGEVERAWTIVRLTCDLGRAWRNIAYSSAKSRSKSTSNIVWHAHYHIYHIIIYHIPIIVLLEWYVARLTAQNARRLRCNLFKANCWIKSTNEEGKASKGSSSRTQFCDISRFAECKVKWSSLVTAQFAKITKQHKLSKTANSSCCRR